MKTLFLSRRLRATSSELQVESEPRATVPGSIATTRSAPAIRNLFTPHDMPATRDFAAIRNVPASRNTGAIRDFSASYNVAATRDAPAIRNFSASRNFSAPRGGFSLLEVLVVIGISALLGALVTSGFRSFNEGNRRGTCATNLSQIYRAGRLYADDFGAFPPYDASNPKSGGLWLLWGFDDASAPGGVQTPERALVNRYLRSPRAFHCPSDPDSTLVTDAAGALNKRYLSYQVDDGGTQTYQPRRTQNLSDPDYPRQLLHFDSSGYLVNLPTPSNTVVTWCKWHRNLGSRPDNVLFYDGSVRRLAIQTPACSGGGLQSTWRRRPDCLGGEGTNMPAQ